MISCTEFIPAYSELFKYLDKRSGRQAVSDYWSSCFDPDKSPLNKCLDELGLAGCYKYWSHTLNEEAADFTMTLDEEEGYFRIEMHACPSKGKLIKLAHLEPFDEYCLHCDLYRKAAEKHGFVYKFDCSEGNKAKCRISIYDPKIFKGEMI